MIFGVRVIEGSTVYALGIGDGDSGACAGVKGLKATGGVQDHTEVTCKWGCQGRWTSIWVYLHSVDRSVNALRSDAVLTW